MEEVSLNVGDGEWKTAVGYPTGVLWKTLWTDDDGKVRSAVLKLPAGFEFKPHSHLYREHHHVIEGAYESGGRHYGVGTYRMIPGQREHGPFRSENGAVILVIWEA